MEIAELVAELARTTPYSRSSLESAVANMRFTARLHRLRLQEAWIPDLLRVAVTMRTLGVPAGEALLLAVLEPE